MVRTTTPTITSATAATAALTLTNTATGTPALATLFGSATTAASYTFIRFGVNATLGNYSEERFNYTASASTSNNYEMRVTANSRFQITNNDTAPFTVTNPSGPFAVTGAISAASLALTTPLPTTSGGTGLSTVGTAGQVLSSNGTSLFWALPSQTTTGTFTAAVAAIIPLPTTPIANIRFFLSASGTNTNVQLSGNTFLNGLGVGIPAQEPYEQFQQANGVVLFTNSAFVCNLNDSTQQFMFEITIMSGATTRKQFYTEGVHTRASIGSTRLNGAGYLASTALSLIIAPATGTITGSWTIT